MTPKLTIKTILKDFEKEELVIHELSCSVIQDGGECHCDGEKHFKSFLLSKLDELEKAVRNQLLDEIKIEKKFGSDDWDEERLVDGFNLAIDQLEELKNKLR